MTNSAVRGNVAQIEELIRQGQFAAAEVCSREMVRLMPHEYLGWSLLGMLTLVQGRAAEAEAALREAIALQASDGHLWTNLGHALRAQAKAAEAEACARQAVALEPASAMHWIGLGLALADLDRWEDAAEVYRQIIARDAGNAEAWSNLGKAEQNRGQWDAAKEAYAEAARLSGGGDVDAAARHAWLLVQRGEHQQGLKRLHELAAQSPQVAGTWLALGNAYRFLEDLPRAEAAFREALRVEPASREARYNLALVLAALSAWHEALGLAQRLVGEDERFAEGWLLLGTLQHLLGEADEAVASLQQALAYAPSATMHSKLLFTRQYADGASAAELLALHRQWDAAHGRSLVSVSPPVAGSEHKKDQLRLGFVAPDFLRGPTGFLAVAVIEELRRLGFSIVCYADGQRSDDYTARFRAAASLWRTTGGSSDEELAAQVRQDEIDVLFDLAGHAGARLLTFARKPAPVQITWLGYVGTTGLTAMDFLLADRFHVPAGEESLYAERILRMPQGYACYSPPPDAPPVGALPALSNGWFTFGCFNSAAKYAPRIVAAWAQILSRVPRSRLLLKDFALADDGLKARLWQRFAQHGIDNERLLLEGPSSQIETMASYSRVDLALDTQPYSGGLTTCEALWMGVPVITFPGQTFAGRHSTSHMTNAGYGRFVAQDLAGYMALAADWPAQLDELAAMRSGMREHVRQSPLCDAARFARELATRLRQAWDEVAPPARQPS